MQLIKTYKLNSKLETESKDLIKEDLDKNKTFIFPALSFATIFKDNLPDKNKTFTSNYQQEKYYRHLNDNVKVRRVMFETVLIWLCGYFFGFLFNFQF